MNKQNKFFFLLLIIFYLASFLFSQDSGFDFREFKKKYDYEHKSKIAPSKSALLSLFIPGSGFIYLGRWFDAGFFLAAETYLLNYSIQYQSKITPGEYNVPYKTLDTLRCMEVFSTYTTARKKYNNAGYRIPYEKCSTAELLIAPFKPKNFLHSSVLIPAIVAAALTVYEIDNYEEKARPLSEVKEIDIAGKTRNVSEGTMTYGLLWTNISLDAGVGEEMLFRGFIQSELANRTGDTFGLISSSILFGVMHMLNPGQATNTNYFAFATLAGIYFGTIYINNNYQLSLPISAHFWWDFMVGTIAFLKDPANNPLGAKVTFAF